MAESVKQPADGWIDEWINRYEFLISFQDTHLHSPPKGPIFPISEIQKQSVGLTVSLQMLLQEATTLAYTWKDVNYQFDDRRSFPTFLSRQQTAGFDLHKYMDNDLNVSNQPYAQSSLQEPSYDHSYPELTSDSNWLMANTFLQNTFYLMQVLQKVYCSEATDGFSKEQAGMLEDFLGHLIMIQKEQRDVAYSFSEHMKQLRNSIAASSRRFSSNEVDDEGKSPLLISMRHQKHLFDSLHIISRALTWLLKKFKDSRFTSHSFVEESEKIVEITVDFISNSKDSKELLDRYLERNNLTGPCTEDQLTRLVLANEESFDCFGNRIKFLQEEGVGKGSVLEILLDCLRDVCKLSMDGYVKPDSLSSLVIDDYQDTMELMSSLGIGYKKAVQETMELIEETRKKLNLVRFSTLSGVGSPLGNVTLWRILFESSLAGLRLDLVSKKLDEASKLGARLLEESGHRSAYHYFVEEDLHELHAEIRLLLSDGAWVLHDFVAMHKTVAEITYMLGDAFTTGGAGMKDLRDETSSPGSSSKSDEEMERDIVLGFPWDKHNVPRALEFDLDDPDMMKSFELPSNERYDPGYGPHSLGEDYFVV